MHSNLKQSQNSMNKSIETSFMKQNDNINEKTVNQQNQSLINVYGMGTEIEKLYNSKPDIPRSLFHNWQPSFTPAKQDLGGKRTTIEQQKVIEMNKMQQSNKINPTQLIEIIVDQQQIQVQQQPIKTNLAKKQRNETITMQNNKQIVIQKIDEINNLKNKNNNINNKNNNINNKNNNINNNINLKNLNNQNILNNQNNQHYQNIQNSQKIYLGDNGRKELDPKVRIGQQSLNKSSKVFGNKGDNLRKQLTGSSKNVSSNVNNKVCGYLKTGNSGNLQHSKEINRQRQMQELLHKKQKQQQYQFNQQQHNYGQMQQHNIGNNFNTKHIQKQNLPMNPSHSLLMNSLYNTAQIVNNNSSQSSINSSLNLHNSNILSYNNLNTSQQLIGNNSNPIYWGNISSNNSSNNPFSNTNNNPYSNSNNNNPYSNLQQTNHHLAYLYGLVDDMGSYNNSRGSSLSKFISQNNNNMDGFIGKNNNNMGGINNASMNGINNISNNNIENIMSRTVSSTTNTPLYYKQPKLVTNQQSNKSLSNTIKKQSALFSNNLTNNNNKQTRDIVLGKKDKQKQQPQVIVLDSDQEDHIIEEKHQNVKNQNNNINKDVVRSQQGKGFMQIFNDNLNIITSSLQQKMSLLQKPNKILPPNQHPHKNYSLNDSSQIQQHPQSNYSNPILNKIPQYPNYNQLLYENSQQQLLSSMMKPPTYYNNINKPHITNNNVGYLPTSLSSTTTGKQYKQLQSTKYDMGYIEKTKHIQKGYHNNNKHDNHHHKTGSHSNDHLGKIRQLCRQQQKGLTSLLLPQSNNNLQHLNFPQYTNITTKSQLLFPNIIPNNNNISNPLNNNKNLLSSSSISPNFMQSFTQQKIQNINSYLMKNWNTNNNNNSSLNNNGDNKNDKMNNSKKFDALTGKVYVTNNSSNNKNLTVNNNGILTQTVKQLSQSNKQTAGSQHIKRQAQKAFLKTRSRINNQNPTSKSYENDKKQQKKDKTSLNDYQKSLISQLSTKIQSSNQQKDKYNFQWTPRLKKLRQLTKKRDFDSVILVGPDFQADIPKFITNQHEMRTIIAIKRAGLLKRLYKHASQIQEKQQV